MREFPNLDAEEEEHLSAFIRTFVRKERRHRWRSVLSMKTERWVGASAHDVTSPEFGTDWNTPRDDVLEALDLGKEADREAVVFSIGHGAGSVTRRTLREAMSGPEPELEAVVSIRPGRLAVVLGHSNEVFLCRA